MSGEEPKITENQPENANQSAKMTPDQLRKYVSDGFELAKGGKAAEIYAAISPYHDAEALDPKSHYAFGWIIYYALHQASKSQILERKKLLVRYFTLKLPRPHKQHSMILTEAIRLSKDADELRYTLRKSENSDVKSGDAQKFSLVKFINLWGLANLREGDWRRKDNEGIKLSSTVEKLITAYVGELEQDRSETPSPEFMEVMEKALAEYSDSSNLLAQRASLFILDGDDKKAEELLRKAILGAPGKFFLWSRLADIAGKEDVKLRIALLYKALSTPGQEEFKGKIRLRLAEAWMEMGVAAFAKWELAKIKELYQRNDWHLSPRVKGIEDKISSAVAAEDPTESYRLAEKLADDFIYSALPETPMKKTYHKAAEEKTDRYGRRCMQPIAWRLTDDSGNNVWFNPGKFRLDESLPAGTRLMVKIHNGKVVKARICD